MVPGTIFCALCVPLPMCENGAWHRFQTVFKKNGAWHRFQTVFKKWCLAPFKKKPLLRPQQARRTAFISADGSKSIH